MAQTTIVVTDLTRFQKNDRVCIAGIDPNSGRCIRPLPYLTAATCKKMSIFPGGLLKSEFTPAAGASAPHTEDCNYGKLYFTGPASGDQFHEVLAGSCFDSITKGFEVKLKDGEKVLPSDHDGARSLITIKVDSSGLEIVADKFQEGKIKAHVQDSSGRRFSFLPITDLGFHDYALKHHERSELDELNEWISGQDELFLRIGLSRAYQSPKGSNGYWIQVNGIYTFPEKHPLVRKYEG